MKKILVTAGLCSLLAAPVLADDSQRWFESPSKLTQQTGQGIYEAVCASCHMPQGEGAVGAGVYPPLAGNPVLAKPEYAARITIHGKAAMPGIGALLDDAQIAEVVNYIRTNFGNSYTDEPATAEFVATLR